MSPSFSHLVKSCQDIRNIIMIIAYRNQTRSLGSCAQKVGRMSTLHALIDLSFHKHHSQYQWDNWTRETHPWDHAMRVTENPQCRMPCIIGPGTGWTGWCFCLVPMEDILVHFSLLTVTQFVVNKKHDKISKPEYEFKIHVQVSQVSHSMSCQ